MNGASSMHLSIFGMHPVIVHGSEEMKRENLPRIVNGDLHVCFGVTEPGAGLDTTRITTFARRDGSDYVVNGRKVWISKAMESEKVLLLTRTTRFEDVAKKTDGLTLFLTDLDRDHVDIRPIRKMGRNAVSSNELFIDDLRVPEAHRVGEEGQGLGTSWTASTRSGCWSRRKRWAWAGPRCAARCATATSGWSSAGRSA